MSQSVTSGPLHVVWFKRDLRVQDHQPLARASAAGSVLPLYIVEPDQWRQVDASGRQWGFVAECLEDLRHDLARLGQPLLVRHGEALEVFRDIKAAHGIAGLWSHQETGNGWSYRRDIAVDAWCRAEGIAWHQLRQHGVWRGRSGRDGWAKRWDAMMGEPVASPPALAPLAGVASQALPGARDLGLRPDPCPERQAGGRVAGAALLGSFLTERGQTYRAAMATPVEGAQACSRLSPHLAWGTLSMREVAQATWARQRDLKALPTGPETRRWRGALTSFNGRLHWHCHFIQKLEDAPQIETRNLHPAYDGLRPAVPDATRLAAWAQGETGLPFVDACMRSLNATGWLNFRARAMLTAVASYHLWLDWRAPGEHLARLFTDYEPGIHWPQVQMQSGTTGINTVRIYNPVKQGYDQDPQGQFIRRWVPELRGLSDLHIHEPWRAPGSEEWLDRRYPRPIVDHLSTAKAARERVWAVRRAPAFRAEAAAIQAQHGSRRSGIPMRGAGRRNADPAQLSLDL